MTKIIVAGFLITFIRFIIGLSRTPPYENNLRLDDEKGLLLLENKTR